MANPAHLAILRKGVEVWNQWLRQDSWKDYQPLRRNRRYILLRSADLSKARLRGAYLRRVDFSFVNLRGANLTGADLCEADLNAADLATAKLSRADLSQSTLQGANLRQAQLVSANLTSVDLSNADLSGASLRGAFLAGANLSYADLTGADLTGAHLQRAILVETKLTQSMLSGCSVYGISAWNVDLTEATQRELSISGPSDPSITVDNLKLAQFVYLMLNNADIRDVIDTVTSKVVLILGRFTPDRKRVLDAIREVLRQCNYVPVLFDFEGSSERNFTETVTLLARMARFIIADVTEPSSIPQELQAIVPHVMVPVCPLLAKGFRHHAMLPDFTPYPWMLKIYHYNDRDHLLATIQDKVIAPAEAKVKDIRKLR